MNRTARILVAALFVFPGSQTFAAETTPVFTFAGSGQPTSVEGIGAKAGFNQPLGIFLDAGDNLYVADSANHCICKGLPGRSRYDVRGIRRAGNGGRTDSNEPPQQAD